MSLDSKVPGHSMEIFHGIRNANQVALIVAKVFHFPIDLFLDLPVRKPTGSYR